MAEIFKGLAYDPAGIKKTVCIKKILSHIAASQEFIDMLVDEAKIAVQLSHGNIAQVYDLGKAGDDYFIVMEFVEGQSLSKIFKKSARKQKPIPVLIACYITAEIASGLNYMHTKTNEQGEHLHIVHRDISPQNIVVSYSGTVKIIDFGIAKAAVKVGHTESGILKGKFAYMSPEHASGEKVDHRSDLFSLGVIFYELLTGQRLFKGEDNKQTLKNVRRAKVGAPSKVADHVPEALDEIVLKALAKNRRDRYAFASDFQEALLRFLHLNYPDFKPAQAAQFIQELFQEELALTRKLTTQEIKTPHLILEKTQASDETDEEITKGGGGIDWREFMLEMDWPGGEEAEKQEARSREEEEEEMAEATSKKWFPSLSFPKQTIVISLVLAGLLGVGIYFGTGEKKQRALEPKLVIKEIIVTPAAVTIESEPSGARIFLNDVDTGKVTPTELKDLATDQTHHLGLHLPGHQYYKVNFALAAGETKYFHVVLGIDYAALKILSNPPEAQVWVDGKLAGLTPLTQEKLEPGRILKIEIQKEGYQPFRQEIKLEAGKEQVLHTQLEKVSNLPQP